VEHNASIFSENYVSKQIASTLFAFYVGLLFDPEDGGSLFLVTVGKVIQRLKKLSTQGRSV
jgi:hypothetical protein